MPVTLMGGAGTVPDNCFRLLGRDDSFRLNYRDVVVARNDGEQIRLHLVPLLNEEALRFKHIANRQGVPSRHVFEYRDQDRQRVIADDRPLRDRRQVFVLRHRYGVTVAAVDVQHDVNVRAAVAHIYDAVRPDFQRLQQMIDSSHLTVPRGYLQDALDLALGIPFKLRAMNMVRRNDALQRRADDLHRPRRDHVKIEVKSLDLVRQEFVQRIDIWLEPHPLARFVQMLLAHLAEFRIVQQQVRQFASLLHEVQFRHSRNLALVLARRNSQQLAENKSGVIKAQRLVEVAGEDKSLFLRLKFCHLGVTFFFLRHNKALLSKLYRL